MTIDQIKEINNKTPTPKTSMDEVFTFALTGWQRLVIAIQKSWKIFLFVTIFLVAIVYFLEVRMGQTLTEFISVMLVLTWFHAMYLFHFFKSDGKYLWASSIGMMLFVTTVAIPSLNETDIQLPSVSIALNAKRDTVRVIQLDKGVSTKIVKSRKTTSSVRQKDSLVLDGRSPYVNASVEANEGQYEKLPGIEGYVKKRIQEKKGTHVTPESLVNKDKLVWAYVKRFYSIARGESVKFGIPISIKLAQGILESDCGLSYLSNKAKNHFGVKYIGKGDEGRDYLIAKDDGPRDKFKIFNSAWESYRNHSLILTKREFYKDVIKIPKSNYKGWAEGLEKAGYATDKQYAEKLIAVIERYQLYKFDM